MTPGENWNTPQAQTCLQRCVTLFKHDAPACSVSHLAGRQRMSAQQHRGTSGRGKKSPVRARKDGQMSTDVLPEGGNVKMVHLSGGGGGLEICSYLSIWEKASVFEALQDMNNTLVKPLIL